jgi:DNA processing protein
MVVVPVFDLLVLTRIPSIGSNRLRALISYFGSTSDVFEAPAREISKVDGFSKVLASRVARFCKDHALDEAKRFAERQLSRVNHVGGHILSFWDKRYPDSLKKIFDPPPLLFVKGEMIDDDKYSIAIVGTRAPSEYGIGVAERFSQELAKLGITVVSGLARGIDTFSHAATLKSGGRTIAVIGSGLDVLYPPENRALAERISQRGAVVSEFDMGAKPDAVNFPRRNRIISGLSLGTLVVETDINGGAMITANTALDQNREVFAIPGTISVHRSRGCHALIKDGRAKLVESVSDILDELAPKLRPLLGTHDSSVQATEHIDLSLFEQKLYDLLDSDSLHIDQLAERTGLTTSDALVNLLSLEFRGLVKQLPGKMFVKR